MTNWDESKAEALEVAATMFELATVAFDSGLDVLALSIEHDARAIEKHYTADRRWVGRNGRR